MKKATHKLLIFGLLLISFVGAPLRSQGESVTEKQTDAGIGFTRSSESGTKDTEGTETVPSVPQNPTSKPVGRLPMTGELLQPVMMLFLAWFVILLIVVLIKRRKQETEEEHA